MAAHRSKGLSEKGACCVTWHHMWDFRTKATQGRQLLVRPRLVVTSLQKRQTYDFDNEFVIMCTKVKMCTTKDYTYFPNSFFDTAHLVGFNIHLLWIQYYCCKDNRTVHSEISFLCILLNTHHIERYLLRFSFNTLILGYKIHRLLVSVTSTINRPFWCLPT
jgi:hypothetical protein